MTEILKKSTINGVVEFKRSKANNEKEICGCCPDDGGGHIYSRSLELEAFDSNYPKHFGMNVQSFIGTEVLCKNEFEGKRVRITVEVIDD